MKTLLFPSGLLRAEVAGEAAVVKIIARRLDESNAEPLGQHLSDLVDRLGARTVRLDLDAVEYLTSVVLGMFVGLNKRVQAAGGELCLYNVRPLAYEVFEVTRLTTVLDVRPKDSGPHPVVGADPLHHCKECVRALSAKSRQELVRWICQGMDD